MQNVHWKGRCSTSLGFREGLAAVRLRRRRSFPRLPSEPSELRDPRECEDPRDKFEKDPLDTSESDCPVVSQLVMDGARRCEKELDPALETRPFRTPTLLERLDSCESEV